MYKRYHDFLIRDWQPNDRNGAAEIIGKVLEEFGLNWEPERADRDVIQVEGCYLQAGGQFWVIEQQDELVGTAAFYPLAQREGWAEIRKMYLLPQARGVGLGKQVLKELERQIQTLNFEAILVETSTKLPIAMKLYERNGYIPYDDVETERCDRAYMKYIQPR